MTTSSDDAQNVSVQMVQYQVQVRQAHHAALLLMVPAHIIRLLRLNTHDNPGCLL